MMKTDPPFSGHRGFPVARSFRAGIYDLPVYDRTHIMGILNVTPDSFSDGGQYDCSDKAVAHALEMASSGVDIIDIGGESTRPDHTPVTAETEMNRILPVIRELSSKLSVPISVDTWKASVAEAAVQAGASIINDVWGAQRDPDIALVAARTGSGLILMFNAFDDFLVHRTGNIVVDAMDFLRESIRIAHQAGVPDEQIMIDPGIGFGVTTEESLQLIHAIPVLRELGFPVLLGPSRKRFIGAVLDEPVENRLIGTVAVCCMGAALGANVLRVHDVKEVIQAVRMTDAITSAQMKQEEQK